MNKIGCSLEPMPHLPKIATIFHRCGLGTRLTRTESSNTVFQTGSLIDSVHVYTNKHVQDFVEYLQYCNAEALELLHISNE